MYIVFFSSVPGMALDKPTTGIYRKCNELQVVVSDGKDGGSGVVLLLSVRTET